MAKPRDRAFTVCGKLADVSTGEELLEQRQRLAQAGDPLLSDAGEVNQVAYPGPLEMIVVEEYLAVRGCGLSLSEDDHGGSLAPLPPYYVRTRPGG